MTQARPNKRFAHLLIEPVGSELLIYDEKIHKAYCLNELAALVWSSSDGLQTASTIAQTLTAALGRPVSEELVLFTLDKLRRDDLLLPDVVADSVELPGRREVVRKLGLGAVMMLPVVTAIMAPKAAQAYLGGCVDCSASQRRRRRAALQHDLQSDGGSQD